MNEYTTNQPIGSTNGNNSVGDVPPQFSTGANPPPYQGSEWSNNPVSTPPQIKQAKECPFCDTEKIKSHIVYDYDNVIAFEPLHPVVKGHLLVVPKIHTEDFTEDPDITANTVRVASLIAGERGGDYNLITSKGKCATQSVFHLHIHLVPRKEKDGLMLPWSSSSQAKIEWEGCKEGKCIIGNLGMCIICNKK